MDNLTHSLTGLLLSRAGLNRFHKRATWLLVLSCNAPDLDAVSMAGGLIPYMFYHRWYTHAIVMVPLMALVPVLIVRLLFRHEPLEWKRAWLLSLVGVVSHVLLDYTNSYGIRLWLPFSDLWPRLGITHVVDLVIWAMLLAAVAWPALSSLVSDEIGARRTRGRGLALATLILLCGWQGTRWFLHQRAIQAQQTGLVAGATPRRVFAVPDKVNPLRWKGIVETDAFFATQTVDLMAPEPVYDTHLQYKPVVSPAIEAALRTDVFQTFTKFSAVYLWRTTPDPQDDKNTQVEAIDLQLGFVAAAVVDPANRVISTSVRF